MWTAWTAEALEILRKLALEGRSASVIAAALGATSRSAVIGKANRVGIKLNGRKGSATVAAQARPARQRLGAIPRPRIVSCERTLIPAVSRERETETPWIFAEAQVGEMRRVGFPEIRAFECRWPLGDPTQDDFVYCGLEAAKGRSYCAGHCRIAYRSPKARTREGRREWRWPRKKRESMAAA